MARFYYRFGVDYRSSPGAGITLVTTGLRRGKTCIVGYISASRIPFYLPASRSTLFTSLYFEETMQEPALLYRQTPFQHPVDLKPIF